MAFNRDIHTTSVTLEGDIFQPSGLLTGGSRRYGAISFSFLQLSLDLSLSFSLSLCLSFIEKEIY